MLLSLALAQMVGSIDKYAVRPSGEIITMTPRMTIKSLHSGAPRQFVPKFSDLVADDWVVLRQEQLRAWAAENIRGGGGGEDE